MFLTVLQEVQKRDHSFDGQKLHVSLYYKELGLCPPGIDCSSQFDVVPSDVAVECASEIAGFILHNKSLKQKVTTVLLLVSVMCLLCLCCVCYLATYTEY